jgi:hypothetical protein
VASNPLALLVAALVVAGCGGGAGGTPAPGSGIEDDAPQPPAAQGQTAPKPVQLDSTLIPEPGEELARENFDYRGGTRDPFASLLEGRSVGPELGDLDVVGIAYHARDSRSSTVVLWDRVNNRQYTAREGERVGRARVVSITQRAVEFTIDDFGTQRRVTLALRKQEEVP